MNKYENRAREYHAAIREILIKEWDPIGVSDIPGAEDEYDSYVPQIYSLLIQHKSEQDIFNRLWKIETENMGLFGNHEQTTNVAKLLIELRDKIEKNC